MAVSLLYSCEKYNPYKVFYNKINITFSTCFYVVKSKFDATTYSNWIENFMRITHTNNYRLYIFRHFQFCIAY